MSEVTSDAALLARLGGLTGPAAFPVTAAEKAHAS
jgi:hypothetical protein